MNRTFDKPPPDMAAKKEKRKAREEELSRTILTLPDRRYGVIYADPEWRFAVRSRETKRISLV